MSKKYSTSTSLVIVESPAKCKKIEQYLGPGYKCMASFGHLRELPSLKNIDMDNNFTPTYTIIDNALKKKQIDLIRKEIKSCDEVILAPDGDREGEKIAFCVAQIFKLDINKTKRITFNEVTETALKKAIQNPRTIDMNMVNAQQARQILDLLVGFKVSPVLWQRFNKPNAASALSAGRCQTPALKIIYDNQREISEAVTKKVYNTTGYFTNMNLPFDLSPQGKYETEDEVTDFLYGSTDFNHIYTCSQPIKTVKSCPEPFTTSRLQQVSSNELHYSPKETMKICQTLYEAGYITYMRTDSKTYSREFIDSVKEYIVKNYQEGEKYINKNIDNMITGNKTEENKCEEKVTKTKKGKSKKEEKPKDSLTQDAHEAIRPTNISLFELPETMDSKEKRMYKLIWSNSLESCMSDASFYSVSASISAFDNNKFVYTSEQIDFPGWKIVTKKYEPENKEYHFLQMIKQNAVTNYKKLVAKVTIKGTKQHYTEARLVQLLEEKGIGRPSTFSSLVDKIQERGYVKKQDIKGKEIECKDYELENGEIFEVETKREFGNEKGKLVIQPLGTLVIEFLEENFADIFNYDYTRSMEDSLDKIAKGELVWYDLCKSCNDQVDSLITGLQDKGIAGKMEIKLDENNTYMVGKYGPVIKCVEEKDNKEVVSFKPINSELELDLNKMRNGEYKLDELIDTEKDKKKSYVILGKFEDKDVILKKGKFGLYVMWGDNSKTLKELGNRPIESIKFEEVEKYLNEGSNLVREVSSNISIRRSKKGDYLFYKTGKMKKPMFYDLNNFYKETKEDYKICDATILKSWIKDTHNIT